MRSWHTVHDPEAMEQGSQETHRHSSRVPLGIAMVATVVGIVLRVIELARDRPLWLDEAMLALNIGARPFSQLAGPLDYDQSAPLLYLWIERAIVMVGGMSERSLRLLPFVAGAALAPAVWFVGRRIAGATAATIASVLVAVSVTLVTFSAEAKQYGVDPFATLLVVGLASSVVAAPGDRRRWIRLVIGGVVCLLASQPAAFALGGVVVGLVVHDRARGTVASRRWLVGAALTWSVVFATLYLTVYRATAESTYMQRFWEGTFLDPRAPDFALRLRMFADAAFDAVSPPATAFTPVIVVVAAWLVGLWVLWRRDRASAAFVAVPLALATVASALGFYPVMDRLYLFAAPLTLLAIAASLATIVDRARPPARAPALLVTCVALAATAVGAHAERVRTPVFYGVGKQVVADVDSMSRGEPVYIAARSFPLWAFYTTDWDEPDHARLQWAASIAGAGNPAHNNAPSRGGPAVAAEAARLVRQYRGRLEIVGVPTGRQYVTSTRMVDTALTAAEYALPLVPDSGWADLEVRRMAEVARSRLWVFGSHMFNLDGAEPALVSELQRRGVRLVMERRQGSTVAYHVEFPGEP